MNVLVTVASRHGSTAEIGAHIAEVLRDEGHQVIEIVPGDVKGVTVYDAVVIGSAVYVGRWLGDAIDMVVRETDGLRGRPVWLFSCGPIGDPPKPESQAADVPEMVELTDAREHRVFAGRVDRAQLGLGEKTVIALVRAPEGDFRPWDEIRLWARRIAVALELAVAAPEEALLAPEEALVAV